MLRNILDLPRSLALSSVSAALAAVLVGYSGPLLLVVQAAQAANLSDAQMSSWVWGVTVGSGVGALSAQPLVSPTCFVRLAYCQRGVACHAACRNIPSIRQLVHTLSARLR